MGPHAGLVTGVPDPTAWALGLRALALPGVVEIVPAAETVLVVCSAASALARARQRFAEVEPLASGAGAATVTIAVRYSGADLADVAARCAMTTDAVIAAHTGTEYVAAFCGFSPGFAYLTGLPAELHLPRRDTPRTRVPAGSVAIATAYSAVYPRESPGGWHLLGRTEAVLFDPTASAPALVRPGDRVRFEAQ